MWQQALDFFLHYYKPCDTLEESTDQYSTNQLHGMLERHSGESFTPEELAKRLEELGYKYSYTSEMMFEWLFIQTKQIEAPPVLS